MRPLVLIVFALGGCAAGLGSVATRQAQRELRCSPPALRMRGVGELRVVGRRQTHEVVLYEASGCEQERLYLCAADTHGCAHEIDALPWPEAHAAFERALQVLRTAARARCPASELRVSAESETLFRFEACDGAWLYHCRARGCERLPARAPAPALDAVKQRVINRHP